MPSTHAWDMASDHGEIYRIFVSFPAAEPPELGFPVLYVLDGSEIGKRYKIDPNRQSLFGHSLGGLLALHALYTRPQAFHSIVAASPSLEWNQQGVLTEERDFTQRLTSGKVGKTSRLMVVVGGRDIDDDPYLGESLAERMDELSEYGLRVRFRRYEEENHMNVPARAVTDTLRFVFETY